MSANRITSLIRMQLDDMSDWTITSNSLTGEGELNYTYSYPSQKLYVMVPDTDSISKTKELIAAVFNGDTLESSYDENTGTTHIVTRSQTTTDTNNNTTEKKEEKKEEKKTSETVTSQTNEPEEIEGNTSSTETSSTIEENNTSTTETSQTSIPETDNNNDNDDNN